MIYRRLVRPVLFRRDAEAAHEWTLQRLAALSRRPAALAAVSRLFAREAPRTVFGIRFPNPVGLAAGLDKDGRALPAWPALGFGFVEVGTVTRHAQPGNPQPRLFRLPASQAVINRMGFNNAGALALAERLDKAGPLPVPLGISLGKSKITPLDEAVGDYLFSLRALGQHADYVAVNVSSPNTPGLRALQDRAALSDLLAALTSETTKPILVKVAPDLTDHALGELLDVCADRGVAGLIATNTTLSREGVRTAEAGGLSGRPLTERAREVVTFIAKRSELPVVGVGGILQPEDALRLFDAGACLVQLYTGLIYTGPILVKGIVRGLR